MLSLDQSNYPKGSEWRRWDLHIHTPDSILGDAFRGVEWDAYLRRLEAEVAAQGISVVGITDYLTIDGYERVLADRASQTPILTSVDLVVPNIELRVGPQTDDGKALNVHLLIDPTDPDHVSRIRQALRQLRIPHGNEYYGCIRDELIAYGRVQKPELSDDAAYRFGLQQFKPSYDVVFKWLDKQGWLRANALIGVTNGKDGISGLPVDGFSGVRDQILKRTDFVFSANPNDRSYYLGRKKGTSAGEIVRMYRSLKPCLHGSDAHELDKLFRPEHDRLCWIKADPTFEGLRQVIWEPEERVHIGPSKPSVSDASRIIERLRFSSDGGWFATAQLPLNSGLVAIIGEKGAGKTAIADLIAFAAGVPGDEQSQSSFIVKGRVHLGGLRVDLDWATGTQTHGVLPGRPFEAERPLVRYLSQDFVERLCSADHQGNELQRAIEDVVFSHLDETHREGFSSFDELRGAREKSSQSRRDSLRGNISSLNREVERLYAALAQRGAKVNARQEVVKQIDQLKGQLPAVTEAADASALAKLAEEQMTLKAVENEVIGLSRAKRRFEEFVRSYNELRERTDRQVTELVDAAKLEAVLQSDSIKRLSPSWDGHILSEIDAIAGDFGRKIAALQGQEGVTTSQGRTIHEITLRIARLQASLSQDESLRKRLVDLQKQIRSQELLEQRLTKEIEELDSETLPHLKQREADRDAAYLDYFGALTDDLVGLQTLYAPMRDQIETLGAEVKFEVSAGYRVDYRPWLERAFRFFDGRKPTAGQRRDELERYVAEVLASAWGSGNREKIRVAMSGLLSLIDPVDFLRSLATPSVKMVDLLDWIYSTDHVETSYRIRYGGTALEHLSPGSRGIALLVLYLLLDEDDRRPLVIDQPEGNLDNASIYGQLVPYIRRAKQQRQIILVTHNPNLVVATDAEQIIIATAERIDTQAYPKITYQSGSLEHAEGSNGRLATRQAVCTLLEGGDRAFKEREGRYSLKS